MELQFQNNDVSDEQTEDLVETEMIRLRATEANNPGDISFKELNDSITRLKPKKSPGPDGISSTNLKMLPKKQKVRLLKILNSCLHQNYFPSVWKESTIIMILKYEKHLTRAENHRPISLLSIPGKLLEKMILNRLSRQNENLNETR